MSNKYSSVHLARYLVQNSSKKIIAKAKYFYGRKGKEFIILDQDGDSLEVLVVDYRPFLVAVSHFLDEDRIERHCSCGSGHSRMCMHQAAVFYMLIDSLKDTEFIQRIEGQLTIARKPQQKKRNTSKSPFALGKLERLDRDEIFAMADASDFHRHGTQLRFFDEECKLGSITFELAPDYWSEREEVEYYYEGGQWHSLCTCDSSCRGLCFHEAAGLLYVLESKPRNFFTQLSLEQYEQQKQELIEWSGIAAKDFDKNFVFDYKKKAYLPKGKLKGLINFAQANGIQAIPAISRQQEIPVRILTEKPEEIFHFGYVVDVFKGFERFPLIVPVLGMEAKKGGLKALKNYFDSPSVSFDESKTDKALLVKIRTMHWINSELDVIYFDEDSKEFFHAFNEALLLIANETYKYLRYRRSFYDEKVKKADIEPILVSSNRAKLYFQLSENKDFVQLEAKLDLGHQSISIPISKPSDKLISAFLVLHEGVLYGHDSYKQASVLAQKNVENPIYKAKIEDIDLFFDQVVRPISEQFPVRVGRLKSLKTKKINMKAKQKRIYLSDMGNFVIVEPAIVYDKKIVKIYRKGDIIEKNGDTVESYGREVEQEQEFIAFLAGLHPDFPSQTQHDFFFVNYKDILKGNWFYDFFEKVAAENIKVFGLNKLKRMKYSPYRANVSTHIKSGQDWFDVEVNLSFGKEQISLASLRKAVINQNRFIELKGGKMGILPDEWLKKLATYFRLGAIKEGVLKVSKHKFTLIDSLFQDIDDTEVLQELAAKRAKIKKFKNIKKVKLSPKMTAELRPYQKEGVNWLHFLDEFRWGGILADDMGLGKTVQVLSLLQNLVDKKRVPNLVVVPTTLLFNWKNELQKFAPDIDYVIHYGPDRDKNLKLLKKHDVILTTYGHIIRDIGFLKEQQFNYVILDESQAIKNVLSQRYKAVCLLKAENRIAMTGTPIENNTFDLYAQMNFLNPGFMGTQAGFKRDYSKPIDTLQDADRAKELQKMIAPFVLRRTKEQVAKELPPKIEDFIYVQMEADQQKVYDAYKNKYRDYLLGKIESDGLNKSKMYVLEGLTKLRLICDSPALVDDGEYAGESAKIKELVRHITEKTANHKMLVFSQFTKMLALVKSALDDENITYEYLDGQRNQKQRQESVENFQTNSDIRVFLISLKAGNTGLNLTAADYVYLLDPWWNPAVESQAIDRTHRIGQNKHVIAYRMIIKDSIEEKILKLQARKRKLASDLIQTDESFMKSIQKEDILDLFA